MASTQYLDIAGEIVGILEWGSGSDFPWAKGKWVAFEAFQKYEQYFTTKDNNYRNLNFSQLLNAGISSTQLRLISSTNESDIEYLHCLVLGNNNYASWRFGDEPYGDDD